MRILTSSAQMQSEKAITNEFEILLAQELNRRRVNVEISRKRMELPSIQEQIDLACFVKPEWLGESAAYYEWTKTPLVNVQIIFVGDKSSPLITSMADVKGKRVGAIFGFRYPGLDKLFHEQFALRDDAPSFESLIEKQLLRRTDYIVLRKFDFNYQKKMDARLKDLRASPYTLSTDPLYCGRIKSSTLTQEELETALARLQKRNVLEKIVTQYQDVN